MIIQSSKPLQEKGQSVQQTLAGEGFAAYDSSRVRHASVVFGG
jgi:hypothetical protein